MTRFCDVRADHDKREYYVVERYTDKIVATYKYQKTELSRGVAHGRANLHRRAVNEQAYHEEHERSLAFQEAGDPNCSTEKGES